MSGGTFTISNGGIYGSMLSTPILNPPQSGILGMHNILERPVAIQGKVEIRPMMYLALSYDHRVIDGKDSVGFLKTVKELLEEPVGLIFGDQSPEKYLIGYLIISYQYSIVRVMANSGLIFTSPLYTKRRVQFPFSSYSPYS